MKNSADLGKCYPPRAKAEVVDTVRDLDNSLYPFSLIQIIANYDDKLNCKTLSKYGKNRIKASDLHGVRYNIKFEKETELLLKYLQKNYKIRYWFQLKTKKSSTFLKNHLLSAELA